MSLRRTTAALALCALTVTTSSGCMTRWAAKRSWENKNFAFAAGEVAVGALVGGLLAYDHDRDLPADEKFTVTAGATFGSLTMVSFDLLLAFVFVVGGGDMHWPDDDD